MKTSNNSRRSFLMLLGGSVLPSVPAAAQTKAPQPSISATISVFSGRPDPTFDIFSPAELDKLRALVKDAAPYTKAVQGSIIRSMLGYRGIVVENRDAVGALPARFAIYNGLIEIRGEKPVHLIDKQRTLEKTLVDWALGAKVIDSKLHARITSGW